MSYIKQIFKEGQTLLASDLNTMSEGIIEALNTSETSDDLVIIDQNYEGLTFYPDMSIGSNGKMSDMSTYNTYSFTAAKDGIVYFSDLEPNMHLYLAIGHIPTGATAGTRYRKSDNNLPTKDTPLVVAAGDTINITIPINDLLLSLYTTTVTTVTPKYILDAVKYNDLIIQSIFCGDNSQGLMILKKCGNNPNLFLGHLYSRVRMTNINSNTWRLSYLLVMERTGPCFSICRAPIVERNHEWECAIQEEGASDFCGGTAHGDENFIATRVTLDGKLLDVNSTFIITGRRIEAIEESILNRCDTPGENIMKHLKNYTITCDELKVNQSLEFLENISIVSSYLEMCPVQRQYTPYAYVNGRMSIDDVSTVPFSRPTVQGHNGTFSLWGNNFSIKVNIESDAKWEGAHIFISDSSSPSYNKVYYSIAGKGPTQVEAGTKVTVTNTYNYSYNE